MSNENWTKDEWVVDKYGNINTDSGLLKVSGVSVPLCRSTDKTLANTYLIASAPDLYKALKQLVKHHKNKFGLDGAWDESLVYAEKALAKARGAI